MPSPFSEMDPYLEHPDFWPEIHSRLMVAIADVLVLTIRPNYRVAIEKRTDKISNTNGNNFPLVKTPIRQNSY